MASASASAPSSDAPVEAPVSTPILNGLPAACSSCALFANAAGTAFAAPAGVNPLKPTVLPFPMSSAASSGVRMGNGNGMETPR